MWNVLCVQMNTRNGSVSVLLKILERSWPWSSFGKPLHRFQSPQEICISVSASLFLHIKCQQPGQMPFSLLYSQEGFCFLWFFSFSCCPFPGRAGSCWTKLWVVQGAVESGAAAGVLAQAWAWPEGQDFLQGRWWCSCSCAHGVLCVYFGCPGHSTASSSGRNTWVVLERKYTLHLSAEPHSLNHRIVRTSGAGFLPSAFCPLEWFLFRNISQNILSNKTFAPSLGDVEMLLFGAVPLEFTTVVIA